MFISPFWVCSHWGKYLYAIVNWAAEWFEWLSTAVCVCVELKGTEVLEEKKRKQSTSVWYFHFLTVWTIFDSDVLLALGYDKVQRGESSTHSTDPKCSCSYNASWVCLIRSCPLKLNLKPCSLHQLAWPLTFFSHSKPMSSQQIGMRFLFLSHSFLDSSLSR